MTGSRTQLGRKADRGSTDIELARRILDDALVGHVGIVTDDGYPAVLPVAVARQPGGAAPDRILIHGSTGARLLRHLATGAPICLTVTHLDGLVLARSAFESSMNYRSLVVFGVAEAVTGDAKEAALRTLTEHLTPGRWESLRPMRPREVAATMVMALPLSEFSVKMRAGGPGDGDEDGHWPTWSGVLPLHLQVAAAQPAPEVPAGTSCPPRWLAVAGTPGVGTGGASGDG